MCACVSKYEKEKCKKPKMLLVICFLFMRCSRAGNKKKISVFSDCRLLWEFIYHLLLNNEYSTYICWDNKDRFIFRIVNPHGLAKLWGNQKSRSTMTYEKLSRALRYYYKMEIIKKVPGQRLTYQ